jgi:malonyl CoA-acyl carrier protein transacylase
MTLTFYRGTIIQNWVDQDASGKTGFSMSAVDPSRVTKGFDEAALVKFVQDISSATSLLLGVVNYNIEGRQYVCAGHVSRASYVQVPW